MTLDPRNCFSLNPLTVQPIVLNRTWRRVEQIVPTKSTASWNAVYHGAKLGELADKIWQKRVILYFLRSYFFQFFISLRIDTRISGLKPQRLEASVYLVWFTAQPSLFACWIDVDWHYTKLIDALSKPSGLRDDCQRKNPKIVRLFGFYCIRSFCKRLDMASNGFFQVEKIGAYCSRNWFHHKFPERNFTH